MWILDLADASIKLSNDGEVVYDEPGVALVDANSLVFGDEALAQVKLHPDREQSQYWQRMDQSAVHPPGFAVETQADLVYRQLLSVKDQGGLSNSDQLWVAVPSDMSSAQLALLYGIAVQAELNVLDFVDRGVAAAASIDVGDRCAFIEIGLHRSVVTQLQLGDVVTKDRASVAQKFGVLSLMNTWIKLAADKFLDTARFDPRKFAATEQQVFDQLLEFIALDEDMHVVRVEHQGNSRQVEVSRSELVAATRERVAEVIGLMDYGCPILLSEHSAALPGVVEALNDEGSKCFSCTASDIAAASARIRASRGDSEERTLHTEIPHTNKARSQVHHETHSLPDATHILRQSIAHAIGAEFAASNQRDGKTDFAIRRNAHGLVVVPSSHATVLLNGERIHGEAATKVGDSIVASSIAYQLIAVDVNG